MKQRLAVMFSLSGLLLGGVAIVGSRDHGLSGDTAGKSTVHGTVADENDLPVVGARVRLRHGQQRAMTDEHGRFAFPNSSRSQSLVTAWKEGYFIGEGVAKDGMTKVTLCRLPTTDNSDYKWVDPRPSAAHEENCGNCHADIFEEWQASGHADSARNKRFRSLYEGTDWDGHRKVGWSLRDEHPLGVGVCAACHAPGVNFDFGASDDMRDVTGVAAQGVHCDFCHKVYDLVTTDFGLTHGRFGFRLLRPDEGQLFFGPLDDVARGEDAYSPLQNESAYCASCHEGVVFGTHVYSTYSEWLDSPARRQGKSCQSCHMAPTGLMTNIAPDEGGIERDSATLASHTLLPGGREAMLRRSLELSIVWETREETVACRVTLTARNIGHRLPTGFIDRHLILSVEAFDAQGRPLAQHAGRILPSHAGEELQGVPGRLFARMLHDREGDSPLPFWCGGELKEDTRLVPEQPVSTVFRFPTAIDHARVRVLYRRFWKSVAKEKHWPDDTVIVHDRLVRRVSTQ